MIIKVRHDYWTENLSKVIYEYLQEKNGMVIATSPIPYWAIDYPLARLILDFTHAKKILTKDDDGHTHEIHSALELDETQTAFKIDYQNAIKHFPKVIKFPVIQNRDVLLAALDFSKKGISLCGFHLEDSNAVKNRMIDMGVDSKTIEETPMVFIEQI